MEGSSGEPGSGGVLDRVDVLDRCQEKRRFCLGGGPLELGVTSRVGSWLEVGAAPGLTGLLVPPLGMDVGAI